MCQQHDNVFVSTLFFVSTVFAGRCMAFFPASCMRCMHGRCARLADAFFGGTSCLGDCLRFVTSLPYDRFVPGFLKRQNGADPGRAH